MSEKKEKNNSAAYNLCFLIRNDKIDKKLTAPIYLRITINKLKKEYSTGLRVNPNEWEDGQIKSSSTSPMSLEIKKHIETLEIKILNIYNDLFSTFGKVTPIQIQKVLRGNAVTLDTNKLGQTTNEANIEEQIVIFSKQISQLRIELFSRLDNIEKLILKSGDDSPNRWLKSSEVKKMLNISHGKLQSLRDNGTLPFTNLGGVIFYDRKAINNLLSKGIKD